MIKLNSSSNIIRDEIRADDWIIEKGKGTVAISMYDGSNMDATWLPNVKEYAFGDCKFSSLKLDRHKFDEMTHIRFINGTQAKGGIMSLLTLPKLRNISANRFLEDEDFSKALEIVKKHLEDKNVAECMDELMEVGLKEYAKM